MVTFGDTLASNHKPSPLSLVRLSRRFTEACFYFVSSIKISGSRNLSQDENKSKLHVHPPSSKKKYDRNPFGKVRGTVSDKRNG